MGVRRRGCSRECDLQLLPIFLLSQAVITQLLELQVDYFGFGAPSESWRILEVAVDTTACTVICVAKMQ
jgi:hypothetical protein